MSCAVAISFQLSGISYQLSAISYQPTAGEQIHLSTDSCDLSPVKGVP